MNRPFSSSSLSAITEVLFACLRFLAFILTILILACASSILAFSWCTLHINSINRVTIYSLDVLLSQFRTSLLSHVQFCFLLTCKQTSQEAGQVVWYSQLFKNFPQFIVIHTVKGFGVVSKAEVDVFLEFSYFF